MRFRRHAALGLAAAACLVATSGCTNAADWNANRNSQIHSYDTSSIQAQPDIVAKLPQGALEDGVLDVAASTDYAPAEFLDPSGKAVGYDVDLTNAIAAVLGVEGKVHTAEFDSIIASIGSKYDAGISSFTVTPERTAEVDMTAYVNVGSRFNVQAGNPKDVDTSDHLNLCGRTIGVQVGTDQETAMRKAADDCSDAGKDVLSVRSYSKQSEATTGLVGGTIDATYSDSTVAGYAVELTDDQIVTLGEVEDASPQGVVTSKADPQFTAAVQAAVQYLMDQGIWQKILDNWGVKDAALTTAELNPVVKE